MQAAAPRNNRRICRHAATRVGRRRLTFSRPLQSFFTPIAQFPRRSGHLFATALAPNGLAISIEPRDYSTATTRKYEVKVTTKCATNPPDAGAEIWQAPRQPQQSHFARPRDRGWWTEPDYELKKPLPLIIALDVDGTLTAVDLIINNLLYASAYRQAAEDGATPFSVAVADLNVARNVKGRGTRDLVSSLERLRTAQVHYPLLPGAARDGGVVTAPLLHFDLDTSRRKLFWSPSPSIHAALQRIPHWGKISPHTETGLRSRGAILLYELLCTRAATRCRRIQLTLQQMRALLGKTDPRTTWSALRRQIIEPALARIETATSWIIELEVHHRPRYPDDVTALHLILRTPDEHAG